MAALGERGLRTALRVGRLRELWTGVLIPPDRVLDPLTRASAALWFAGEGAVLSGPTAALAHGCTAAEGQRIHVTVPYTRYPRRRPGLCLRQGPICEEDVVELAGLRVFALDQVIAELLRRDGDATALACLDQALGALASPYRERFRATVRARLARRTDRRGVARAELLLDLGTGLPESPRESALLLTVVDAGFPVPVPQHEVFDLDGNAGYRPDFAWPELRIALEYDGYAAHEDRAEADAARDAWLAGRGWMTIRARAEDLRDPRRLLDEIARAFRARGAAA
ncbi:Protein of unknown function (DUF559) [Streptoalloteichus tenebrarius]|uniref:DUF559 domain-containing protein n=1 Tax=Streptoalloteichus tenebrarius (strain ATCC 17920 / DSM 40477 / JCM 4838 / CBS 697.72 / NBRC 16177 / NCIMB 11028 / NRRL B-12390 / A12253. 1 / ISP 5477) TaxID=1933 RepID=A0ABT1HUZ5_STRSD|nr:DUF559 domain-containing protein [Streptoalloteichus tenebrarius]MCP2259353.1 Protein of unknown function (DUF559) [Streptoalloteichus tenebrarius]